MDSLSQRANERKIYEEVVNTIVDMVSKEFSNDEQARLRIYSLIADNFKGMVRVLKTPTTRKISHVHTIEYGDSSAVE